MFLLGSSSYSERGTAGSALVWQNDVQNFNHNGRFQYLYSTADTILSGSGYSHGRRFQYLVLRSSTDFPEVIFNWNQMAQVQHLQAIQQFVWIFIIWIVSHVSLSFWKIKPLWACQKLNPIRWLHHGSSHQLRSYQAFSNIVWWRAVATNVFDRWYRIAFVS